MSNFKRKNVTIDVSSAEALMQEIYNDVAEQKSTANIIMKKMLGFMKSQEDMNIIGPVIKEQQKIINDCIEKRLSLVKLQAVLLKQGNATGSGSKGTGGGKLDLSEEEKVLLDKLISSSVTNNDSDNTVRYN